MYYNYGIRFFNYVTQLYLIIPSVTTKNEHFLRKFMIWTQLRTIQIILIWDILIAEFVWRCRRCLAVWSIKGV